MFCLILCLVTREMIKIMEEKIIISEFIRRKLLITIPINIANPDNAKNNIEKVITGRNMEIGDLFHLIFFVFEKDLTLSAL